MDCSLPASFLYTYIHLIITDWILRRLTQQKLKSEVAQLCSTLCDPMFCSLPRSSIQGIFQARVLEWVAISFSRGSSQLRDRTLVSRIAGRCFNLWATREACQLSVSHTYTHLHSLSWLVMGTSPVLHSAQPRKWDWSMKKEAKRDLYDSFRVGLLPCLGRVCWTKVLSAWAATEL